MRDLSAVIGVLCFFGIVMMLISANSSKLERQLLATSFVAHALSSFALVSIIVFVYQGGDMLGYYRLGEDIASFIYSDPLRYFPEAVKYSLRLPATFDEYGFVGSSTSAAIGISGLIMTAVGGHGLYAGNLASAMLVALSQWCIYLVARDVFPRELHGRAFVILCLWPSVTFWSAGFVKESFAITGLNLFLHGAYFLAKGRRSAHLLVFSILGMAMVLATKAYIVFPLIISCGWWYYAKRLSESKQHARFGPRRVVLAVAVLGILSIIIVLVVEAFPRFAVDNVAQEAASLQHYSYRSGSGSGSNYSFGSAEQRTLTGQLQFVPLAVIYALFRPFPTDVTNPMLLVNALEMLFIYALWFIALRRYGPVRLLKLIVRHPELGFCLLFTFLLAIGVGLSSTNIGTLSRYRAPLMPFYVLLLMTTSLPMRARWNQRIIKFL